MTSAARLARLEADNASLSAAADEAATLAEALASDAAAARTQIAELKDATRRKDRRIARLEASLAADRARADAAERVQADLRRAIAAHASADSSGLDSTDHNPDHTNLPSSDLDSPTPTPDPADPVPAAVLALTALPDILAPAFSPSAAAVLPPVLRLVTSALAATLLAHTAPAPPTVAPALHAAAAATSSAAVVCLLDPSLAASTEPSSARAARRISTASAALRAGAIWPSPFAAMQSQLLSLAADALPSGPPLLSAGGFSPATRDALSRLAAAHAPTPPAAPRADAARADALRAALADRDRRLDELSVRARAFESAAADAASLRLELTELRARLPATPPPAVNPVVPTSASQRVAPPRPEPVALRLRTANGDDDVSDAPSEPDCQPDEDPIPSPMALTVPTVARGARSAAVAVLADLRESSRPTYEPVAGTHAVRDAVTTARRAAANARVVRLDKQLRPRGGATMSRRGLYEAVAFARRPTRDVHGLDGVGEMTVAVDARGNGLSAMLRAAAAV